MNSPSRRQGYTREARSWPPPRSCLLSSGADAPASFFRARFRHHDSDRVAFGRHRKPRYRGKIVRRDIEDLGPATRSARPRVHPGAAGHQDRLAVGHPCHVALGVAVHDLRERVNLLRIDVDLFDPKLTGGLAVDEADQPRARNAMQRTADAVGYYFALPGLHAGQLQRVWLAEHEQPDAISVDPGVIADRLDVGQDQLRLPALRVKPPQALRAIHL